MLLRLLQSLPILTVLLLPQATSAQTPAERLDRLTRVLDADERHVQLWWYGWLGVYGLAAGAQTGVAAFGRDRELVVTSGLGATSAFLGIGGLALSPVQPQHRWPPLADAPLELQVRAAEAELADRARRERQVGGWLDHTLCAVVAAGAAAYLWLHEDRPGMAAAVGAMNLVVGEVQLWTVPTVAARALERPTP